MENLRRLVVVRKNNRVAFALEPQNGVDIGRKARPLEGRYHRLKARKNRGGAFGDLRIDGSKHVHAGFAERHGTPYSLIKY